MSWIAGLIAGRGILIGAVAGAVAMLLLWDFKRTSRIRAEGRQQATQDIVRASKRKAKQYNETSNRIRRRASQPGAAARLRKLYGQ